MIIIFFLLNYLTSHVVTLENEQRKIGTISINMYPAERSPRTKKKKKKKRENDLFPKTCFPILSSKNAHLL